MKKPFVMFVFCLMILLSCKRDTDQPTVTAETLEELTETKSLSSFTRGKDNLILELYDELLKKNPKLKKLEESYEVLADSRNDSMKKFDKYNDNNKDYYIAADDFVNNINDTVLRANMKRVLADSRRQYDTALSKHHKILKEIDIKWANLADAHNVLVIQRTLQMMEKYQRESLPSIKPIEGYSKEIGKVTNSVTTELSKK